MSSNLTERLEQAFVEREHISEDILLNKQAIIDHDRRRNSNREALNHLKKGAKDGTALNIMQENALQVLTDLYDAEKKTWVYLGNMFMKLPTKDVKELIEKDQKTLDEKIQQARDKMKQKTMELEALDGKNRLQGFDLVAMKANELYGINKNTM